MNKIEDPMDDEDGHRQKYPRNLFVQALNEKESEATTAEVTDIVGCSLETTRRKMHQLEDDGIVKSRQVGPVLVWLLVEN